MNNQIFSLGDIGSALAGAGLTQLQSNLNVALLLVGIAVGLKVLVAVLNKYNIPVSATNQSR